MAAHTKGEAETATNPDVTSEEGKKIYKDIKLAYSWKDKYTSPNDDFMFEMSKLFVDSQVHLTKISSTNTEELQKEADAIVNELISLRNHWGPSLFPSNMTALARERIFLTIGSKQYRIDSAQYFEPIPYYASDAGNNPGELMKLYRFSVYDLSTEEIIMRYFLERSNLVQLYHALCFADPSGSRGQLVPYGALCPTYWELKTQVVSHVTQIYS